MSRYVLDFQEIDSASAALVGGKGAHLAELSRIEGVRVPPGYCVTTEAFRRVFAEAPEIEGRLDRLSLLSADDRDAIRAESAEIREILEGIVVPDDLAAEILRPLGRLEENAAYAVRSSATAEDLPTASLRPPGGSTIVWANGWAKRTRPTRSRNRHPATSPPRWGSPSWTWRMRSARTGRWWRSSSASRTIGSWTSCPGSREGARRKRPSWLGSTGTACAAPARSTSPGRAGVRVRRRFCR